MTKPLRRYQVRAYTTRGTYELMTSAKSTAQAINQVRYTLRNRGVFVDASDCIAEEVA